MELYWFLVLAVGFLLGCLFGKFIADFHWSHNADEPRRIFYKNNFYKVLRLHDYMSKSYLDTVY